MKYRCLSFYSVLNNHMVRWHPSHISSGIFRQREGAISYGCLRDLPMRVWSLWTPI